MKKKTETGTLPPFFVARLPFSFLLEKRKDPKQHHGTHRADQQLSPEGTAGRNAEQTEKPTAQGTADDTNDDAHQKAHALVHDFSGDEACQGSDEKRY